MLSSVVAASAGYIRNAVALKDPCALTLSSSIPDALGTLGQLMVEKRQRFRLETKSLNCPKVLLHLGHALCRSWLRADCKHMLQMSTGKVPQIAFRSHQKPSSASDPRSGVLSMHQECDAACHDKTQYRLDCRSAHTEFNCTEKK